MVFRSILVVNLNRKREFSITEIVTNQNSLHIEEQNFLTMSTLSMKEILLSTRLKECSKEIDSTTKSRRQVSSHVIAKTHVAFSLVFIRILDPIANSNLFGLRGFFLMWLKSSIKIFKAWGYKHANSLGTTSSSTRFRQWVKKSLPKNSRYW